MRVLVVDDSALVRQILSRALGLVERVEVVGVAKTGIEAIEKAVKLQPDIITLDIEMPELTGLEALPFLLKETRSRIIMLSSMDDPDVTYQALSMGATDFITKPKGGFASCIGDLTETLVGKIVTAYGVDPDKRSPRGPAIGLIDEVVLKTSSSETSARVRPPTRPALHLERLVVIAASTGGPPALEQVFAGLAAELPASYLVVQHLPNGFTSALARRLSRCGDIRVVEAEDGMPVRPGAAYLAPYGWHMKVKGGAKSPRILLEDGVLVHGLRPAADPLLVSAVETFGDRVVGVVLTGMGSDGVAGLVRVSTAGGVTIAQDEATSTVWGMPGAAVRTGAVKNVVPLDRVAVEIRRAIRGGGRR